MGRDVLVGDGLGATSPGTRMVPCWLVWRLYKPKSETKPIQYMSASKQDNKQYVRSLFLPLPDGPVALCRLQNQRVLNSLSPASLRFLTNSVPIGRLISWSVFKWSFERRSLM